MKPLFSVLEYWLLGVAIIGVIGEIDEQGDGCR
jgi:hypothetical protein